MKISHYFDFVINSYDAGIEKPNVEIFKLAMKQSEIEDLKPSECLHIGHSILPDYFGAQKAGLYNFLMIFSTKMFLKRFFRHVRVNCT